MQKKKFCVNISFLASNKKKNPPSPLHILFGSGFLLIFSSLFYFCVKLTEARPLNVAQVEEFGEMLEYPTAAVMLLTAGLYLIARILKAERT